MSPGFQSIKKGSLFNSQIISELSNRIIYGVSLIQEFFELKKKIKYCVDFFFMKNLFEAFALSAKASHSF